MSYQTRGARGNWVQVQGPTDYAGITANYAAQFIQAQLEQTKIELKNKILDYQNGIMSYKDLKDYLNTKLTGSQPGSSMELDIRETILDVEKFETDKQKAIKRAQLESKFAKGGISASERLQIEKDLLQFYKEGTPEYSEQLATISTATELKRQEDKNIALSKLEARLSEGGLDTGEQIQLLKEAQGMTDKGTKEFQDLQSKINLLTEEQKKQQMEEQRNQRLSEMLDQYAGGGLTTDELLSINREMQSFTEKGTEDYIKLKEAEAGLLGDIAQGKGTRGGSTGGGGSAAGSKNSLLAELEALEAEYEALENKFEIGAISQEDYLNQKNRILADESDFLEGSGDIVAKDATLSRFTGELKNRANEFTALEQGLQSGDAALIVDGKGKQRIVPLSELGGYADEIEVVTTDEEGNEVRSWAPAITTQVDGKTRRYALNADGKLESLSEETRKNDKGEDETVYVRSGIVVDKLMRPKTTGGQFNDVTGLATPLPDKTMSWGEATNKAVTDLKNDVGNVANKVTAKVKPFVPKISAPVQQKAKSTAIDSILSATGMALAGPVGATAANKKLQQTAKTAIKSTASKVNQTTNRLTSQLPKPVATAVKSTFNPVGAGIEAGRNLFNKVSSLFRR